MSYLLKTAADRSADPVRRGIRHGKLRELLLNAAQLPHERVVLVVLDGRGVQVVVIVIVLLDDCAKLRSALFRFPYLHLNLRLRLHRAGFARSALI